MILISEKTNKILQKLALTQLFCKKKLLGVGHNDEACL